MPGGIRREIYIHPLRTRCQLTELPYETLIDHMRYALQVISETQAQGLAKGGPGAVRKAILGFAASDPLLVVDEFFSSLPLDAEVGTRIHFPEDVFVEGKSLIPEQPLLSGRIFKCIKPGICRAIAKNREWACFVRVAKFQFVGLSRYRHLEEEEDE